MRWVREVMTRRSKKEAKKDMKKGRDGLENIRQRKRNGKKSKKMNKGRDTERSMC